MLYERLDTDKHYVFVIAQDHDVRLIPYASEGAARDAMIYADSRDRLLRCLFTYYQGGWLVSDYGQHFRQFPTARSDAANILNAVTLEAVFTLKRKTTP